MGLHNKVATCLATNVGRVRTNNEDSLAEDRELGLLVLADGMGGYNAGEVASAIATTTVVEIVRRDWNGTENPAEVANLLKSAVQTAHERIRARAAADPECAGMGTTAIACVLNRDQLAIAHVGDSRVYRWRQRALNQLTQDHSLLEELIARGHYTREDANRLVRKNIVTRALGVEEDISVDLIDDRLEIGDLLLLCSDGLTDMLDDSAIAVILGSPRVELQSIARALIEAALTAGGRDNVSVALARVDQIEGSGSWSGRLRKWWQAG
ncbi:MAG: Stp1/IreP family PP2C-type Ser/Thr phosphatase [Hydrocarboniphaga sp.]|uniref:Stp1/IreP family PP2C-type Ser/Thr phosphatase n=1 Tax=Hydrocarboniphaga sp. TaxID=2033016 RepID=UPI0026298883|nr:Stp1/IreP family PP2C-type Ser/Thr phosphatase [Hydrocarboniphaga sp.]MDB5968936.1 Stp1/IreP family PP2C-type Ser/Thr phosphatase [Hydrocarboniphaga sp.]